MEGKGGAGHGEAVPEAGKWKPSGPSARKENGSRGGRPQQQRRQALEMARVWQTNPSISYFTGSSAIMCTVTLALPMPPPVTVGRRAIRQPVSSGPAKMRMYQASLSPPLAWTQTSSDRRELVLQKWILAAPWTHSQRKCAPLRETWCARVIWMPWLPSKQIYSLPLLLASSILQHSLCHYNISCG